MTDLQEVYEENEQDYLAPYLLEAINSIAQLEVKLKSAEFWSNWVYPEGATAEDVQNELADFKDLIDRFSKVLDHATGGRMSKANYTVEAMCSEIDAHYADALKED